QTSLCSSSPDMPSSPLPTFTLPPSSLLFFFNDPAPPAIYTLSLHDALPIYRRDLQHRARGPDRAAALRRARPAGDALARLLDHRSEEHTSELQSRFDLVCRLLLEKKKKKNHKVKKH